jgi:hypothetical protein
MDAFKSDQVSLLYILPSVMGDGIFEVPLNRLERLHHNYGFWYLQAAPLQISPLAPQCRDNPASLILRFPSRGPEVVRLLSFLVASILC